MIEKTTGYRVGETFHKELADAQVAAIAELLKSSLHSSTFTDINADSETPHILAEALYEKRGEIIAIFAMSDDETLTRAAAKKPRKRRSDAGKARPAKNFDADVYPQAAK